MHEKKAEGDWTKQRRWFKDLNEWTIKTPFLGWRKLSGLKAWIPELGLDGEVLQSTGLIALDSFIEKILFVVWYRELFDMNPFIV